MAIALSGLTFGPLGPIDAVIDPAKLTVVIGPNGAGKSLLLRLLHGLERPQSGTITGADTLKQAMLFHEPMMLDRSVRANLEWAGPSASVERVMDATGVSALADRRATDLSRGEQQRVALGRAWMANPQLVLADEPTANLDPAETKRVEGLIDTLRSQGIGFVLTTHDLGQARRLADDVIVLVEGMLVEHTPAAAFWEKPLAALSQRFVAGELLA